MRERLKYWFVEEDCSCMGCWHSDVQNIIFQIVSLSSRYTKIFCIWGILF